MPKDFLPKGPALCEWCENMKLEFAAVASSLGFTAAETLAFLADLNWVIYVCRSSADAPTNSTAWVQFRETHLHGDPGQPVGTPPNATAPALPRGATPANGTLPRIRVMVKRIKASSAYTPTTGQTLRIVPTATPVDDASAKPDTRGKALPMFKAELRCKRRNFDAVRTRCRRDGEPDWLDLGLSVGTTVMDERPLAEPSKPEVRTYEQIYARNNQPVSQWSDSVRVTLQP